MEVTLYSIDDLTVTKVVKLKAIAAYTIVCACVFNHSIFSILILRLDLAMPLKVPYYEKGDRWTFDKINFGNSDWRKNNLILNIAIGYPF